MKIGLSLNVQNILNEVPEESIWHFIFQDVKEFEIGEPFSIRGDDYDPSAKVFWGRINRYLFRDFGNTETYTFEKFIAEKYKCSYLEALELVRQAFKLDYITPLDSNIKYEGKCPEIHSIDHLKRKHIETFIRYKSRKFGSWKIDYDFWTFLSEDDFRILKLFNVRALSHYWIIKELINMYTVYRSNPTYCYVSSNKLMKHKLYSPYSSKTDYKWLSNVKADYIFGLSLLPEKGDVLVIESSLKDTMTAFKLGIPAIPSLNETTLIPKEIFYGLSKRFKHIISHMNSDKPGIKANTAYENTYGIKSFINEGNGDKTDKDNFAYANTHGLDKFKEMYLTLIHELM